MQCLVEKTWAMVSRVVQYLSLQLADLSAITSVSRDIRTRGMLEGVVAT